MRKKNKSRRAGLGLKEHVPGLFLLKASVLGYKSSLLNFFGLFFLDIGKN
jgi:hypothetical protein